MNPIQHHRPLLLIASAAAVVALAGCSSDGEAAMDESEPVVIEAKDLTMDAPEGMIAVDMPMGDPADFAATADGGVVFETDGYAEVKSADGRRLLVVDPSETDLAEVAEDGEIKGEDFKLMGPKNPITGVVVLGENDLKAAFYARWGIEMDG
ncbi:MAG: hypothetical protein AAGI46_14570 [Planctomycetota bacterium]